MTVKNRKMGPIQWRDRPCCSAQNMRARKPSTPSVYRATMRCSRQWEEWEAAVGGARSAMAGDRKSTRLNSSHLVISYAVFCLKKKTKNAIFSQAAPYTI